MLFKRRHTRWIDADGKRVPPRTPGAKKITEKAKKWTIRLKLADGRVIEEVGYECKESSRQKEHRLRTQASQNAEGIGLYIEHEEKPLEQHLADYHAFQVAAGVSAKQARQTVTRCRRMFEGCRFRFIRDVRDDKAQQFLGELRKPASLAAQPEKRHRKMGRPRPKNGCSEQTLQHYVVAWRAFFTWMAERGRTARNPLERLKRPEVKTIRHQRRALTITEAERLLATTRASCRTFREMSAADRFALYLICLRTGLRKAEAASLTHASFDFDAAVPVVTVEGAYTKNGDAAVQPLHPDAVELLRTWLASKPEGSPLFPGKWLDRASTMLRKDLADAGIPYRTPEGVCDIHSLRHSFVTWLARSGASELVTQELARHSDARLTKKHYTHLRVSDTAAAVVNQPSLSLDPTPEPHAIKATGTDGSLGAPMGALAAAVSRDSMRPAETLAQHSPESCRKTKPLENTEFPAVLPLFHEVPPAGFEPAPYGLGNRRRTSVKGDTATPSGDAVPVGALMGAPVEGKPPVVDAELARLIESWPTLPPHIRAAVLALVNSAR